MTLKFRKTLQTCLLLGLGLSYDLSSAQVLPDPELAPVYRAMDCPGLLKTRSGLEEWMRSLDPQATGVARLDRNLHQVLAEWEQRKLAVRAALTEAISSKQCDKPQVAAPSAVPSGRANPAQLSVAPPAAGMLPQIGVRVDAVSPGFAQTLGLTRARGALVAEVEPGGPAQKAGLQALDVITEITGQAVQSPADLQESLGRMRPGFKAQLRVWRSKAMRDVVVEIADVPLAPAVAASLPSRPSAVAVPQPGAAAAPGGRFGLQFSLRSVQESNAPLLPSLAALLRTTAGKGLLVAGVNPGSPADKAGLQMMDVLMEIDGQPTNSYAQTLRIIQALPVGQEVDWVLLRQGVAQKVRGATSSGIFPPKPPPAGSVCFSLVELAGVSFFSDFFSAAGWSGTAPSPDIARIESEFVVFLDKHLNANPGAARVQTHCGTSSQHLEAVLKSRTQAAVDSGGDPMRLAWRPLGQ